jgi:hypothetical protein
MTRVVGQISGEENFAERGGERRRPPARPNLGRPGPRPRLATSAVCRTPTYRLAAWVRVRVPAARPAPVCPFVAIRVLAIERGAHCVPAVSRARWLPRCRTHRAAVARTRTPTTSGAIYERALRFIRAAPGDQVGRHGGAMLVFISAASQPASQLLLLPVRARVRPPLAGAIPV